MRIPRSHSVHTARRTFVAGAFALLAQAMVAVSLAAQETPPPAATQPAAPAEQPARDPEARPRPRRQAIVIEAGTVHPVAGPAIDNGVVVVRGERIVAVGKKGEVQIPENATVRAFPTGHVYPGLVDAETDAYTDASLRADGGNDGGSTFADDLRLQETRHDELVQAGITTAYVTVRSPALVRGQGVVVRPRQHGFDVWQGKEHAALQMRLTDGPVPSHALQRQQQQAAADGLFEGLEEFRKTRTDHEEALKKYDKEFADYLAFHQKKKDGDKKPEGQPDAPKTGEQPAPERPGPGNRPGGRPNRGGGNGNEPPKDPPKTPGAQRPEQMSSEELEAALTTLLQPMAQDPAKQDPAKQDPPKQEGPQQAPGGGPQPAKDEGPKRPTYPKPPARDPQREALLKVLDGELPLRIEAHRPDELRAALRMQRERQIPVLVLEQAYGAASLAEEIAKAGASVVLTDGLPVPFDAPYENFDTARLPAKLHAAGVPFAIASGRATYATLLPLLAAAAVGGGLPSADALRAITLTPAEILGVAQDTGSLQAGKYADVLVTDRPLFQTDSRVLMVLAKGRTEYEVK